MTMKPLTEQQFAEMGKKWGDHLAPAIDRGLRALGLPEEARPGVEKVAASSVVAFGITEALRRGFKPEELKQLVDMIDANEKRGGR